jgi:hypothetical protein
MGLTMQSEVRLEMWKFLRPRAIWHQKLETVGTLSEEETLNVFNDKFKKQNAVHVTRHVM